MGRKPRVMHCGALYHIIQRGNNRNYIYEDISDKKMFIKLLAEARDKCGFHILYYVLMDNHYHVILEAGDIPISKGVQRINTLYSKYYNKKYGRTGGIYGGRYTASLITDTKYYFQLIRYIARNPVKAGIAKEPRDYMWGAHREVRSGNSGIVNIDRLLAYFPSDRPRAVSEYLGLVENDCEIRSEYGLVPVKEEKKLSDALDQIMRGAGISPEAALRIKRGDKDVMLKKDRDRFMREAYAAGFKVREIAGHISYSYEGVRRIVVSDTKDLQKVSDTILQV